MKRVAIILALFVVSFGALAQEKSDVKQSNLKGPEYKNFKSWMHKSVETKVYSASEIKTLQGPEYKNQQFGNTLAKSNQALVTTSSNEHQKLKGPEYKNFNHHTRKSY